MAGGGASADYTLITNTLDGGGLKGTAVAADYEIDFSMGAGGAGVALNDLSSRTGFAGGLTDVVALEIDRSAASWSFNEQTTRQLEAHLIFDDGTLLPLVAAEVDWSVIGGPISEIDATGNATAGTVYQNTAAVVQAVYAGNSGTRTFSILNVGNDDFGVYAADGLPDLWQVGYFGENGTRALPEADADSDGLPNLLEFAFGTDPLLSSCGTLRWSGQEIQSVGLPVQTASGSGEDLTFQAVFGRRIDRAATGLTYSVEFSLDLVSWHASTAIPTVMASGGDIEVVSVPFPFSVRDVKAGWFRVNVESGR